MDTTTTLTSRQLIAVPEDALKDVLDYLEAHASFKRTGYSSHPSNIGADRIQELHDRLQAGIVQVSVSVS